MKTNSLVGMLLMGLVLAAMAGCGGGGSSPAPAPAPTPVACVDSSWSPELTTEREGKHFTQTSNCGNTRDAVGTWKPWVEREQFGTSVAVLYKNYSDSIRDISAAPDTFGGSIIFGRESIVAKNNKGILTRLDAAGNEIWKIQIDSPLGNTFIPHAVTTDGNRIVVTYERLPLQDWNVYAYDMAGNGGLISETNIGYGLTAAKVVLDGNNLLISRVQPAIPLPAPFPFSANMLFYASLISSDVPINAPPAITPTFITVDAIGVNVIGDNAYMKYARDLSVLSSPVGWHNSSPNRVIHDVNEIVSVLYIAGAADGILALSEVGNPAFRNTANIPVGTDKVRLGADDSGNLYVAVGNRIGRVNRLTGEISTLDPPAVPANAPWYISGANVYFVLSGNAVHVLPLTQIP